MNREVLQRIIDSDTYGLLRVDQRSLARKFFEDECNYSLAHSIKLLVAMVDDGRVHLHEQLKYGRVIYLFNDGSSMQLCGWGNELNVVEFMA